MSASDADRQKAMTEQDQEFVTEFRRGFITMARAAIRRFGLAWSDFLPRDAEYTVTTPYQSVTQTLPYPNTITPVPILPYPPSRDLDLTPAKK